MKGLFPHNETTRDLTVRVSVSFLRERSEPAKRRWFWTYHIRLENDGDLPVQLISREWLIGDAEGGRQIVQGDGVVGEQPIIEPGGSYDYVSGCPLSTSSGWMEGRYFMVSADGSSFEAVIPRFALTATVVES